jgi:hypothetical protein
MGIPNEVCSSDYYSRGAVGNDVDARGNIQSGSLLVERMTIAGE